MPRTVLRQFTGGLSNEVDAQNLREDQGEEALDINLKGFALEPGEGVLPISPDSDGQTGHYYYRGEWVRDSKAVSFEESGIGVIKTYNDKRPEFEEIIKDENLKRDLGPPLPPEAELTGTIVTEGTRGERPGEGSHLLKLPETVLGGTDTTQSLVLHEADATSAVEDIHFYGGQPHWIVKTGSDPESWIIKKRNRNVVSGVTTWLTTYTDSNALLHNSKGSFFKDNYFVCWDDTWIESVNLENFQLDSFNTIDPGDGGDAGSHFSASLTSGATSNGITGVDINNGIVSFTQKITTLGTAPASEYAESAKERWIRMPDGSNGCFVVLLRDGMQKTINGSESVGTGDYTVADDDVEVWTDKNEAVFKGPDTTKGWIVPHGELKFNSGSATLPEAGVTTRLATEYGDCEFGFKYGVVYADNATWVRVLYKGVGYPEIMVIENALSNTTKSGENAVKDITCTREVNTTKIGGYINPPSGAAYVNVGGADLTFLYKDYTNIELTFPSIKEEWQEYTTISYPASTMQGGRSTVRVPAQPQYDTKSVQTVGNKLCWRFNAPLVTTSFPGYGSKTFTYSSTAKTYFDSSTEKNIPANRNFLWDVSTKVGVGDRYGDSGYVADGWWEKFYGVQDKNLDNLLPTRIIKKTSQLGVNNFTTPTVPGRMNRLCSFSPPSGVAVTQGGFGVSKLWTKARIKSTGKGVNLENFIEFAQAKDALFRVGDWIKIGQNGTNQSMHLNLRGGETYIVAKILEIYDGVKLKISPPEVDHLGTGKYLDEDCYPVISSFINYDPEDKYLWDDVDEGSEDGPNAKLIKTDLSSHVLIGHGDGRLYKDADEEHIECREAGAGMLTGSSVSNNTHQINWGREPGVDHVVGEVANLDDIRGVTHGGIPIILYSDPAFVRSRGPRFGEGPRRKIIPNPQTRHLYSQDGSQNAVPTSVTLSNNGKYFADGNYLTHIDNNGITVYTPSLKEVFVKARPKLPSGLGLTGDIQDARTFVNSSNAVFVCVKIADKWRFVKTGNNPGPETSLLSYDFEIPIGIGEFPAGTNLWGIGSDSSGGWDLQNVTPFYESDVIGGYIYYANEYYDGSNAYNALHPASSAWGEITNTRLGSEEEGGIPRYLSVHWLSDSGLLNNAGKTIGLNNEDGKLIGSNEFKWYPFEAPNALFTGSVPNTSPVTISNIPGNSSSIIATLEISFESEVTRDVVFFKASETLLPSAGDTGGENRIVFLNYTDLNQAFYVLDSNRFGLSAEAGKAEEKAYKLGQADSSGFAFDASKVGISTFLLGAPNMYNAYGPNIDFYYRASFINKWGHESSPSPLPNKGIAPLNSADDCIQVNFAAPFFKLTDTDIEKIRLYRYGGDSSEFLFLRDIDMPVLPVRVTTVNGVTVKTPYFPTLSVFNSVSGYPGGGYFARKDANSPYYLLKTFFDISTLGGFVNSTFDFTTTTTTGTTQNLNGSWRINQLTESPLSGTDAVSTLYQNELDTKLSSTAVEIETVTGNAIGGWPASGVVKIDDEYISYTGITHPKITGCTRGVYNSNAVSHEVTNKSGSANQVTVVEWVLEMEHRNQDTTELTEVVSKEMTGSANVIKVADTSVFPAASASGSPGPKKILIGNDIYTYVGKTAAGVSGATIDSFTGVTHTVGGNSSHDAPSLVRSYDESYNATSLTGTIIAIDGFGYRDKARTPIASLHSMQIDNYPPLGLKYNEVSKKFFEPTQQSDYFRYIKSVGGMYFAALDSNLRFSKYGTPEYWPLEAVITLDSEIRCIEEHAGEGIVFTTNSVYRVRGTDPKTMIVFRVPDARGIPAGYEHTVSDYNGGLVWLTASDGLAMYSGGKVTYLTRDKHDMGWFKSPHSCVVDGVYWLFQEPGNGTGYRLELTAGEMRLGKTSIEAYYAYYAKALGMAIVVTKDGTINSGEVDSSGNPLFIAEEVGGKKATNMSWKSKKIDTGEPAIPKALGSIAVVYEVLDSKKASGCQMRGQALAASLLKLNPADLNAGDMAAAELLSETDLYSIFTKYDEPGQSFTIDMGGDIGDADLSDTERRTIIMPTDFDHSSVIAGDRIWNELLADNTTVESSSTPTELIDEKFIVTAAGTGYGTHNDASFVSGDIVVESFGVNGFALSVMCESRSGSLGWGVSRHPNLGGLKAGTEVVFLEPESGSRLPAGIIAGTTYYIHGNSGEQPVGDSWQLSRTLGGGEIRWSGGELTHVLVTGCTVSTSSAICTCDTSNLEVGWISTSSAYPGGTKIIEITSSTSMILDTNGTVNNSNQTITFGDAGEGTNKVSACFIKVTDGGGTGFLATYEVNSSTGAIETVSIKDAGQGYTSVPSVFVISDPYNDTYGTTAASGAIIRFKINPEIVLDKEPLRTGVGTIYWGNLPKVEIYLDNDDVSSRSFILPPGNNGESLSMDLYLKDLKRFRTISVSIEGNVRVKALSLRHYPLQRYQSATLHHSADVFYKGDIDFRIMLDGNLIYRKGLSNLGDEFKEERIYLPASSFGQRAHYMNESRTGMIESVKFNGTVAA